MNSNRATKKAANDPYTHARLHRSVPALVGVRVQYTNDGRTLYGVIVDPHGNNNLHIILDGNNYSDVFHPLEGLTYYPSPTQMDICEQLREQEFKSWWPHREYTGTIWQHTVLPKAD